MSDTLIARDITFEEILPIWRDRLWPGRKSEIAGMSSMVYLGGYNMEVYILYQPYFTGVFLNDELVGVNSGHNTGNGYFRSRGIWVDPKVRGRGVAQMLFIELAKQARGEGCKFLWSVPRKGSEYAYLKFGFEITSDWFDKDMEFGPNAYCLAELT